ncbi:predicted protein [Sclerotinia sclerotiorum 1980 UF-70]|uniref:Uncharacterized protein n=1 Tax=Sclerotinia sclerotiorum (strain ATCC 18683 / 1980 / Ss-1) TaxID=665079 RepID=A7ENM7_SCLS1|nr:predicted protein [Sclerotinia sclerotiorum 1980 UF-70]EDO04443.1 predicted protein [Sclerotinia sclerotiorum 1980 UF-70]
MSLVKARAEFGTPFRPMYMNISGYLAVKGARLDVSFESTIEAGGSNEHV